MSEQLPLDIPDRVQQQRLNRDDAFLVYYLDVMSERPQRPIAVGDRVLCRSKFLGIGIIRMPGPTELVKGFLLSEGKFIIVRVEWLDFEGDARFSRHYVTDLVRIGRSSSHIVEGKVVEHG